MPVCFNLIYFNLPGSLVAWEQVFLLMDPGVSGGLRQVQQLHFSKLLTEKKREVAQRHNALIVFEMFGTPWTDVNLAQVKQLVPQPFQVIVKTALIFKSSHLAFLRKLECNTDVAVTHISGKSRDELANSPHFNFGARAPSSSPRWRRLETSGKCRRPVVRNIA